MLTKYVLFHKRNLYHINLRIPKPHCSLRVAHTTSVPDKYIYIISFPQKDSIFDTKGKVSKDFQCGQTTSNHSKALLKLYFLHSSSDLHVEVGGIG